MYTELKVMRSAAGYYIGRGYIENGMEFPGSRESGYYRTEEEAQKELDRMSFDVRDCNENDALYRSGQVDRPITKQ
jgi:hypothetical protein